MPYNMSLINGSGTVAFIQTVNDKMMFGYFGTMFLITLGIILFMAYYNKTNSPKSSAGFSSLIVAVMSVFMRTFNLVPDIAVLIAWILAAIIVLISFFVPD